MEEQIAARGFAPSSPQSGWWKAPASLATDPVFLRVEDEYRIASVGLYVAAVSWAVLHNSEEGWVPNAALTCGQVLAAHHKQLVETVQALAKAGIFSEHVNLGIEGYFVAGAEKAVLERFKRIESAANAGRNSQKQKTVEPQPGEQFTVDKFGRKRFDPDIPVDWSSVSEDL